MEHQPGADNENTEHNCYKPLKTQSKIKNGDTAYIGLHATVKQC